MIGASLGAARRNRLNKQRSTEAAKRRSLEMRQVSSLLMADVARQSVTSDDGALHSLNLEEAKQHMDQSEEDALKTLSDRYKKRQSMNTMQLRRGEYERDDDEMSLAASLKSHTPGQSLFHQDFEEDKASEKVPSEVSVDSIDTAKEKAKVQSVRLPDYSSDHQVGYVPTADEDIEAGYDDISDNAPSEVRKGDMYDDDEQGWPTEKEGMCARYCWFIPDSEAVREMMLYIVFLVLFSVLLLARIDDRLYPSPFFFQQMATERFCPPGDVWIEGEVYNFDDIQTVDDLWQWLEIPFVESLHPYVHNHTGDDFLRRDTGEWGEGAQMFNYYFSHVSLIGDIRIIRKRVETESCDMSPDLGEAFEQWIPTQPNNGGAIGSRKCIPKFKEDVESCASYGPNNTFKFSGDPQSEINSLIFRPDGAVYGSGGFSEYINIPPNQGNWTDFRERTREKLSYLRQNDWIDEQTAIIFIDFNLFNPSTELFNCMRLSFQMTTQGGIRPERVSRVHRIFVYETIEDWVFVSLEVIFYSLVLFYFGAEVQEMYQKRCAYLHEGWNYLDIVNIVFFVCTLTIRCLTDRAATEMKTAMASGDETYLDFQPIAYTLNGIKNLTAFNALLCWIKLFKYLGVSPNMSQLTRVLSRAWKHILIFLFMFFIVYFGFAKAFYLSFGTEVEGYKSIQDSFYSLFRMLLGDFDFENLQKKNSVLGPLLFVFYIFLVLMVLFNMFLAIINDAYAKTQEEMEDEDDPFARELQQYFVKVGAKFKNIFGRKNSVEPMSQYNNTANGNTGCGDTEGNEIVGAEALINSIKGGDLNNDNVVDKEELKNVMAKRMSMKDAEMVASDVMDKYDKDKDGELNEHELAQMSHDVKQKARDHDMSRVLALSQKNAAHMAQLDDKLDTIFVLLSQAFSDPEGFREKVKRASARGVPGMDQAILEQSVRGVQRRRNARGTQVLDPRVGRAQSRMSQHPSNASVRSAQSRRSVQRP